MKHKLLIIILILLSLRASYAQEDFTKYVDPTIGTVPLLLRASHPIIHLPNQMISMTPAKKDYISPSPKIQ